MSRSTQIRALLREHSDGLLVAQLAEMLETTCNLIWKSLQTMPDSYIDRWITVPTNPGHYAAVWCVIVPPAHCPRPNEVTP